jgi:hypothetical protein
MWNGPGGHHRRSCRGTFVLLLLSPQPVNYTNAALTVASGRVSSIVAFPITIPSRQQWSKEMGA